MTAPRFLDEHRTLRWGKARSSLLRAARRITILLVVVAGIIVAPGSAAAAGLDGEAPHAPSSGAYFGAGLDWSVDGAMLQRERLGFAPAVLEHATAVPITDAAAASLAQFIGQAEGVGALPAITLRPAGELGDFDADAADAVVAALARARGEEPLPVYVRFAPDMNSNWVAWGQDPTAYVTAFRELADALHDDLPGAVTVWSPAAGEGYPFAAPGATDDVAIDTDGDGRLSAEDDPYRPYYPGARYVDWVGLSAYHEPPAGAGVVNKLPQPGDLVSALQDGADPEEGLLGFYTRYAATTNTPLMLETAAFFSPGGGGASALDIKQAWWRQVLAAVSHGAYPLLRAVLWRDSSSIRGEIGETVIDWSVSRSPEVAAAFRSDASAGGLVFAPLKSPAAPTPAAAPGVSLEGVLAWVVCGLVLALALVLMVWGTLRGHIGGYAYRGPPDRDLRIDFLQGVAIVFVVVNHIALVSLLQSATQETIGVVSGAELFVLLSGAVLAMGYRTKVVGRGIGEVTLRIAGRAWRLYATALVLVLIVGGLSLIGFVNSTPATSFADRGRGFGDIDGTGRLYDLYANFERVLRYPVDPGIVVDLFLLRIGPWQVNVLGLYVVMLLTSPLILWALARGRWIAVLALSGAIYASQLFFPLRVLRSQFEDAHPVLAWQVLFVSGMVLGFHRREIINWFTTRTGQIVLVSSILAAVLLAIFSWNNPYVASGYDVRLRLVPPDTFSAIYALVFERTSLDPGRLVNVFLVTITGYAALSVFWDPLHRLLGWFFVPLGQATLYVLIMHVLFVLVVANVPVLLEGNILINFLAYLVILTLLWIMVKMRFLFALVPR